MVRLAAMLDLRPAMRAVALTLSCTVLLALNGCGPVLIGSGIAQGTQGGGSGEGPDSPQLTFGSGDQSRTEHDRTILSWDVSRGDDRLARAVFEYQIPGEDPMRIAPEFVAFDDSNLSKPMRYDAGRAQWLFGNGAGSIVWDHARQIRADTAATATQVEFRDARIVMKLGDEREKDPDNFESYDLLTGTIGRQLPSIEGITHRQLSDGRIEIRAVLDDFGGDWDERGAEAVWRVDLAAQMWDAGTRSFEPVALESEVRRVSAANEEPTVFDALRYEVTARFDPLADPTGGGAARILAGRYDADRPLPVRLVIAERYSSETRFHAAVPVVLSTEVGINLDDAIDVGRAPVFAALVPRPTEAEPRPWFRVPIQLTIRNPMNRRASVRVDARYRLNNGSRTWPTSLAAPPGVDPTRLVLGPEETRVHYLHWDVVGDEGFGIPLTSDDPLERQVAELSIRAVVLDAATAGTGQALPSDWLSSPDTTTPLFTPPFVEFREQLLDPDGPFLQLESDGNPSSARTRDLFYSRSEPDGSLRGAIVGVDQSYARVEVPDVVDFVPGFDSPVAWVVPTDFAFTDPSDPNRPPPNPDCIVQWQDRRSTTLHLEFAPGGVITNPISGGFTGQQATDLLRTPPISFRRTVGGTEWRGGVILRTNTRGNRAIGAVTAYVFTGSNSSDIEVHSSPDATRAGTVAHGHPIFNFGYNGFGGEFDTDPETVDIVFASTGTEGSGSSPMSGFLDVLSFRIGADGTPIFEAAQALPDVPRLDPGRALHHWFLVPLPVPEEAEGTEKPDLLLVRDVGALNGVHRELEFWRLRQDRVLRGAAHGFVGSAWEPLWGTDRAVLVEDEDLPLGYDLPKRAVHAVDLDGGQFQRDGKPRAEILLTAQFGGARETRIFLLTLGTRSRPSPVCRSVLQVETGNRDLTLFGPRFVDVNGDDFLDFVIRLQDDGRLQWDGRWLAYSSAFSGVAGGLGTIARPAGAAESLRPAALDLDGDGSLDLIAGGRLFYGSTSGEFTSPNTQIFGSVTPVANVATHILTSAEGHRADEMDVLTWHSRAARVNVLSEVRDRSRVGLSGLINVRLGAREISAMEPYQRRAGEIKELAAVTRDGVGPWELHRLRIDTSRRNYEFETSPAISDPVAEGLLTTVRTESLEGPPIGPFDRADPTHNRLPQVLVAALETSPTLVCVDDRGAVEMIPIVGAEEILAVSSASIDHDDALEDIVVLSRRGRMLRVSYVRQSAAGGGAAPSFGTPEVLIQHGVDAAQLGGYAFAFNPFVSRCGHGVVMLPDQLRFVVPAAGGTEGDDALMIRSRIDEPTLAPNTPLVLSDFDRDENVEVLGATGATLTRAPGIFRVERGYRGN